MAKKKADRIAYDLNGNKLGKSQWQQKGVTEPTPAKQPAEEAEPKPEEPQTTFKGKVNAYGFIHLNKKLQKAWDITKGTKYPLTIELTAEGNLILRKA